MQRHLKTIIITIIAINLLLFGAVSKAKKSGNDGTYSKNGDNTSSKLKIKNHMSAKVKYYVRTSNDQTCAQESNNSFGVIGAESDANDVIASNKQHVIFCTSCDNKYLVYNEVTKYDPDPHPADATKKKIGSTSKKANNRLTQHKTKGELKHMNIYCDGSSDGCGAWNKNTLDGNSYYDVADPPANCPD